MDPTMKWELLCEIRDLANYMSEEEALKKTAQHYRIPLKWLSRQYYDEFPPDESV